LGEREKTAGPKSKEAQLVRREKGGKLLEKGGSLPSPQVPHRRKKKKGRKRVRRTFSHAEQVRRKKKKGRLPEVVCNGQKKRRDPCVRFAKGKRRDHSTEEKGISPFIPGGRKKRETFYWVVNHFQGEKKWVPARRRGGGPRRNSVLFRGKRKPPYPLARKREEKGERGSTA